MIAIAKKELRLYFNSMIGYIFLFFTLALTAIFFFFNNVLSLSPMFGNVLSSMVLVLLLMAPLLTMRLFAEELRQKTDQLLFTSPIKTSQIVIGKFAAACFVLLISVLITGILPILLSQYGTVPWGEIFTSFLGYFLLGCAFIAVGLFVSSLTENQIAAAVGTFAVLFLMYLCDSVATGMPTSRASSVGFVVVLLAVMAFALWNSTKNLIVAGAGFGIGAVICTAAYFINNLWYDGLIVKALQWVSVAGRYSSFSRGIFDVADVFYYLSFCAAFVYLTINRLEKRRWG